MSPLSTRWLTTTSRGSPASIVASRPYGTASIRGRHRDGAISPSSSGVATGAPDVVSLVMPRACAGLPCPSRDQRPGRTGTIATSVSAGPSALALPGRGPGAGGGGSNEGRGGGG